MADLKDAERVLRELVTLKDMKDECVRIRQRREYSITKNFPQGLLNREEDYKNRKPLAWKAARELLAELNKECKDG
jgi:hypothetical protein